MLKGGLPGWEEMGYGLYAGPDYEKRVKTTIIPAVEFKAIMDARPGSFQLVDVREPGEYADGHIPGAINIPVTDFTAASRLEKGKTVVIYCKSGARSYTAFRKLKKLGFGNIWQVTFDDWTGAGFPVEK